MLTTCFLKHLFMKFSGVSFQEFFLKKLVPNLVCILFQSEYICKHIYIHIVSNSDALKKSTATPFIADRWIDFFFYLGFLSRTFTTHRTQGEGITLTLRYHFYPLHRHLDISWAITAQSSPLHIASSQTRTGSWEWIEFTRPCWHDDNLDKFSQPPNLKSAENGIETWNLARELTLHVPNPDEEKKWR